MKDTFWLSVLILSILSLFLISNFNFFPHHRPPSITLPPKSATEATPVQYIWDITYKYKSPDCYRKLVTTINGESPGPTILAKEGDIITVIVKNSLFTESVSIHWHGIKQFGSPEADGTTGFTQCPILPGETFNYTFALDRAGTFMYHAHYEMQQESGLYGMIIVSLPDGETEPFSYDHERTILLNDWYHKSTNKHATGLSSIPYAWVGDPQSLLINGRGKFDCSTPGIAKGLCNSTSDDCSPYAISITPGKTYWLRIGCLTALAALSFEIEGHDMTVVATDSHYVEPFVVKRLYIYSGETYAVLVTANQDPSRNYWAMTKMVSRNNTTPNGLAIFNYILNPPTQLPPTLPPSGPSWDDLESRIKQSLAIKAHPDHIHPLPKKPDRVIILLNTQNLVNGYVKWAINNVSLTLPVTPYLVSLKYNLPDAFDQIPLPDIMKDYDNYNISTIASNPNATSSSSLYKLKFKSTIDIILQNANMMKANTSETHPWHLHGHNFWVLGYGNGKFNAAKDPKKYNLANPVKKNTVPLHSFGWTALRFVADNPGVWAFHCHIEAHFFLGMGVVFAEGIENVGTLPPSIMGCADTKKFIKPNNSCVALIKPRWLSMAVLMLYVSVTSRSYVCIHC